MLDLSTEIERALSENKHAILYYVVELMVMRENMHGKTTANVLQFLLNAQKLAPQFS